MLKNQVELIRIMDLTLFSIFESVSFLIIQTLQKFKQTNKQFSPFFSDLLSNLEERVNVKRPFELVTILQNGQICFSGRNLGVRIPKNNPEQLPYYMALLGRMLDSICPASKGCILQG